METYEDIVYDHSRKRIQVVTLEGLSGMGKSTQKYQLDKILGDCNKTPLKYNENLLSDMTAESMALMIREFYKALELETKKDDQKIVLCEGGFSSIIVNCLAKQRHSIKELERIFLEATNTITDFHNKFGYLELILIPEHINIIKERFKGKEITNEELIKQQDLIQGFQLFKDTKWGRCFDSEVIVIKENETILDINKRVKEVLNKYNLALD